MTRQEPSPGSALGEVIDRLAQDLLAQPSPAEVLDRAVRCAGQDVAGASSVSISLVERGRVLSTAAATDDLARTGDSLQYRLGEGPCLDAVRATDAVHCRDLTVDPRWPRWGTAVAADLGVRSMLSVQLRTPGRAWGSFNVYGRAVDAFDPTAVALAGSVAVQAAVAYARVLDRTHLERALITRNLIGQAQGILMERHRITAARAFEVLAGASQQSNTKLVEIARRVVETGVSPPRAGR